MNIFVLDANPIEAARMMCDKHIPKMVVETAQMMASALRRHGATDDIMPLAKTTGRPYKGGYHHHPCTVWCGDTQMNYLWLLTEFAQAMPDDFKVRGDAVSAYRNYYSNDKRRFASWNKGTPTPQWWETKEE